MQNQWLGIVLIAAAVIIGLGISVLVSRTSVQRLASMIAFLVLALAAVISVVIMAMFGNGVPTLVMALLCLILPSGAYALTIVCVNRKSFHTEAETYFNTVLRGDARTDNRLDFRKPLEPAFEGGGILSPSVIAASQKEPEMLRTVSQSHIEQVQDTIAQAAIATEREDSMRQSFEQPVSRQILVVENTVTDKFKNDLSGLDVDQALREMIERYTKQGMDPRPRQQKNDPVSVTVEQPTSSDLPIDPSAKPFKPTEPSQEFSEAEQPIGQVASGEEELIEQSSTVCKAVEVEIDTCIGEQNDPFDTVMDIMEDGKPLPACEIPSQEEPAHEELPQEEPPEEPACEASLQEEPPEDPAHEALLQEEPPEEPAHEELPQEEPPEEPACETSLQEEPPEDSFAEPTFGTCQAKARDFVDKGVYDVAARLFEESAYLALNKNDVQNALLLAVEYYVKANRLIDAKGIASELNNEIDTLSAGNAFKVKTVLGILL